ncbi:MAG: hypothetical protein R2856_24215 [Caldilineaceae bacterium]
MQRRGRGGVSQVGIVGSAASSMQQSLISDSTLADGYTFVLVGDNWTYGGIDGYDMLLVAEGDAVINTTEVTALRQYYESGRSIILGMDDVDNLSVAVRNELYAIFGVANAQDNDFAPGQVSDHPIGEGVAISTSRGDSDNDSFAESGAQWVVRGSDGNNYVLALPDLTVATVTAPPTGFSG